MNKKAIQVVAAGVVLFVWGFVSWALLPWHNSTARAFADETAVGAALKANAPESGVYFLPFRQEDHKPGVPTAFVNVLPNGMDMNMGKLMAIALLGQILAAALVLWLLGQLAPTTYGRRVLFSTGIGLAIGFISHFPYWNWFGFATPYVLVIIADTTIAWTLAGLVLAKDANHRISSSS